MYAMSANESTQIHTSQQGSPFRSHGQGLAMPNPLATMPRWAGGRRRTNRTRFIFTICRFSDDDDDDNDVSIASRRTFRCSPLANHTRELRQGSSGFELRQYLFEPLDRSLIWQRTKFDKIWLITWSGIVTSNADAKVKQMSPTCKEKPWILRGSCTYFKSFWILFLSK